MSHHHSDLTPAAKKTFIDNIPVSLNDADWESAIQWKMKEIKARAPFNRKSTKPEIVASIAAQFPKNKSL